MPALQPRAWTTTYHLRNKRSVSLMVYYHSGGDLVCLRGMQLLAPATDVRLSTTVLRSCEPTTHNLHAQLPSPWRRLRDPTALETYCVGRLGA